MSEGEVHCFVGHVFSREQIDDLRRAIRESFEDYPSLAPWFADDYYASGPILGKIRGGIDNSLFCIFEVSHLSKPNVFIELGYAMAKDKTCILLVKDGQEVPSDLAGLDRIQYKSMAHLTQALKTYLPQVLGNAVNKGRLVAQLDTRVVALFPPNPSVGDAIDIRMIRSRANSAGVPEERVEQTIRWFEEEGYIAQKASGHVVTEKGLDSIKKLVRLASRGGG